MKRTAKFALAAVAALGLGAAALPVTANQAHYGAHHGAQQGGMMGGNANMTGGGMGMMMGAAQANVMADFDTDKDGALSPEEITAGIQGELKTYDTDASGALSLDEFAAMRAVHTRLMTVRAFQMHDTDGDAQVTEAELAALAAMMQGHMAGQRGGMPGGMPGMGQGGQPGMGQGQGMKGDN